MALPQGNILSACDENHALAVCLGGCCKQAFVGAYGCAWQIFKKRKLQRCKPMANKMQNNRKQWGDFLLQGPPP